MKLLGFGLSVALVGSVPATARTIAPYTDADVVYGRTLQAKIDAAREASRDAKISKAPMEPFRVVGDLYFAGVHNWGVYLVKTPKGVIMLDAGWDDTQPLLEASLAKLGIKITDIKYILTTEAHRDHNGTIASMKAKSGAQVWVMEGDVGAIESGNMVPPDSGEVPPPGTKVDRVLHDRDQLIFGGKTLTAYHIPGHTPGSTSWVWQETERGKTYTVGDICCWFTPANVVSDPQYSTATLRHNWEVLKSLPIDVPTPGIHTYHFDLIGKLARKAAGEPFPWLDPKGYRGVIAAFERDFEDKVVVQLRDGPPKPRVPEPPPPPPLVPAAATVVTTFFHDVRLFDGDKVVPRTNVLIADGMISAVGAKVSAPAGVTIIEGKGRTLLPGLIDSHVHMTDGSVPVGGLGLEQAAMYGVTTVLEMGAADPTTYQQFKARIKAGAYPDGADMFTAGVGATAPGGHGDMRHLNPTLTSPDQADKWVADRVATGSDYIKIISETFAHRGQNIPTLSAETFAAVVKAAHAHGKMAVAHTLQPERARAAVAAGIDGLVHITPYYVPDPELAQMMKAHHTFESTNFIAYAPVTYKAELAADPTLRLLMPSYMLDGLEHARPFAANANHAYSMGSLKLMFKAGVPILAGTDIGYPYAPLLHAEIAIMARDGGMTPVQALKAATSVPASIYHLADRGRIAPGLRADLLLVEGDPTRNITDTRHIVRVWIKGHEVDRARVRASVMAAPAPPPMGPPPPAAAPKPL